MGLPMYSPSISKKQLPSKQPASPPYTPRVPQNLEEAYQNSRTSSYDIQSESPQRRSRRSSLPYNLVQHMQRLHQLQQLHRTREQQQQMTSNLASRRGLNSSHHLSLNQRSQLYQQLQATAQARRQDRNFTNESSFEQPRNERSDDLQDEIIDFSFDDFVSSLDNNNNNNNSNNNNNMRSNTNSSSSSNNNNNSSSSSSSSSSNNSQTYNDNDNHRSSNLALDNVIRRVNLLRQISQQQERSIRSSSRHHRSSTGHSSSGRSSRITQNMNFDRRRDDLIQRGIDMPSFRHSIPDTTTFLYEQNVPISPVPRLSSAWQSRRVGGTNWSTVDNIQSQPRIERRSSFADDFYSTTDMFHQYDSDIHHFSHILSPIPRRYDSRFAANLANEHDLLSNNLDEISNNNDSIEPVRQEQRGSASGAVC